MAEALPLVVLRASDPGIRRRARFCKPSISDIRAGDLIAMAGPNGSGKTTLFRTILGFLPVLSGLLVRNCALNEFGYVPQSAALDSTFPITAREVVEMGGYGRLKAVSEVSRRREKQRLDDALEQVGLSHLAGRAVFFPLGWAAPAHADRARADGRAENSYSG